MSYILIEDGKTMFDHGLSLNLIQLETKIESMDELLVNQIQWVRIITSKLIHKLTI